MEMNGVIFDFNGTLFFDSDKHEAAWRLFIKEQSARNITDEEFEKYVHGRINSFVIPFFLEQEFTEKEIAELSRRKEQIYRELCLEDKANFKLAEGVVSMLDYLKEQNIPLTIATASGKENLDFYMDHFDLNRWFDCKKIIYNDDTFPGKPDSAIYWKAADKLKLDPEECMVFEDALSGITAAFKANIGCIIAIAPEEKRTFFLDMPEIDEVISDFAGYKKLFSRFLSH